MQYIIRHWALVVVYFYATYLGYLVFQYVGGDITVPVDFAAFYGAGVLASMGEAANAYTVDGMDVVVKDLFPGTPSRFLWFYAPYYAFLLEPLAQMPYAAAFIAWNAATLLFCALALRPFVEARHLLALAAFPPVLMNAAVGQNGFLVAGLLAILCACAERRPIIAGIALAVLSIKPHLGLLIPLPLLFHRKLAVLLIGALVVLALAALAYVRYGSESWEGYFEVTRQTGALIEARILRVDQMVSPLAAVSNLGFPIATAVAAQVAVAVAVAVSLLAALVRGGPLPLHLALAITGTFLVSPYSFGYDWCGLLVPLALLFREARRHGWRPGERPAIVLLYFAGFVFMFVWIEALAAVPAAALAAFYVVLLRRVWAGAPELPAPVTGRRTDLAIEKQAMDEGAPSR